MVTNTKTIRVLVAKPGLDGHDRGAKVIARGLKDAGMEVIYLGLRLSPEQIAAAAVQEDVDVIGLSCLSGAHLALFPRVVELVKQKTDKPMLVIGGGIIPQKDIPALKAGGVANVFGPGTTMSEIARYIKKTVYGEEDMKIKKIDHIGIAVKNIDEALKLYVDVLGLKLIGTETVVEQKVKTAILQIGEAKIELLEATDPTSTIASFIEKRGEGLHHLAVSVDNVVDAIAEVKAKGIQMIDEKPRGGVEKSTIAFMHPKSTKILMELAESAK